MSKIYTIPIICDDCTPSYREEEPLPAQTHCQCGGEPVVEIHFRNFNHARWLPMCDQCYQNHLDNAAATNADEMQKFGGKYGLVTWEERRPRPLPNKNDQ